MRKLNYRGKAILGALIVGGLFFPIFDNVYYMNASFELVGQIIVALYGVGLLTSAYLDVVEV